jgi:hypothetical protein
MHTSYHYCSYEVEKKNHEELKETWEKANDHFVSTHNEYITVINRYREILTTEQLDALKSKSSGGDCSSPGVEVYILLLMIFNYAVIL